MKGRGARILIFIILFLDPKEVEIARAGHVCGKDGVEVEEIGRVEGWGGVDIKKNIFTFCVLVLLPPES